MKTFMTKIFGLLLLIMSANANGQEFYHMTVESNRLYSVWNNDYNGDCDFKDQFIQNETSLIANPQTDKELGINRGRRDFINSLRNDLCPSSSSPSCDSEGFHFGQALGWEVVHQVCPGPISTIALLPRPCEPIDRMDCVSQVNSIVKAYCPAAARRIPFTPEYNEALGSCSISFP